MSEYTQLITIDQISLKREDQNPTGSIKDRSIPHQIESAMKEGHTNFVISSSGNAAISAAQYCSELAFSLTIFVSPNASERKLAVLKSYAADIRISAKPLEDSLDYARDNNVHHLRQATDQTAPFGCRVIARELQQQIESVEQCALFVPVSSGTSFVGIYEGFDELVTTNVITHIPQMHIVQTQRIHPIASQFDTDFVRKSTSIVGAIVPPIDPPRKQSVIEIVKNTDGSGWVPQDEMVLDAYDWLIKNEIETSYEGALALAGYRKALTQGYTTEHPIILLTGKKYE